MSTKHLLDEYLGGPKLTKDELKYLYNWTGDEDLSPDHYARAKDMTLDIVMTNLVRAMRWEDTTFIADEIAPVVPVRSRTGSFKTRGNEALNIFVDDSAADKSGGNEVYYSVSATTYSIEKRKLQGLVSDDEMDERGVLDPVQEMVIILKHGIDLRQEIRIRNLADACANTAAIATDWDTSTQISLDVSVMKNSLRALNGRGGNTLVIPYHIATEVVGNTAIKGDIFAALSLSNGPFKGYGELNPAALQQWNPWGLRILIPDAMYNSATDIADTDALTNVWGDDVFLIRVDKATRMMGWAIQPEMLKPTVIRWRDEYRDGWMYKVVTKRDEVEATSASCWKGTDAT